MEATEIDLDDINTLADFYRVFDDNALLLEQSHDITELLLRYKNKTISDEESKRCNGKLKHLYLLAWQQAICLLNK